jgi:hypothetical protein
MGLAMIDPRSSAIRARRHSVTKSYAILKIWVNVHNGKYGEYYSY